ncbi:hypothetical protein GCM10008024_13700 [Allgaiera indica]|uniref:Uncharacterized protein n=1 Tax=Allgaiera indica TaxID=765699 RepID=A0AAN4UR47_9RHOB|nr:hypothetical protein GCM10008024_13700 [Allgaiera indica]
MPAWGTDAAGFDAPHPVNRISFRPTYGQTRCPFRSRGVNASGFPDHSVALAFGGETRARQKTFHDGLQ